jgi:hypothetical protein
LKMSIFLFLIRAHFTANLKACFGEHLLKKMEHCASLVKSGNRNDRVGNNVFHTGVCVESVLAKPKQRRRLVERRFRHLGFVHLGQDQDHC